MEHTHKSCINTHIVQLDVAADRPNASPVNSFSSREDQNVQNSAMRSSSLIEASVAGIFGETTFDVPGEIEAFGSDVGAGPTRESKPGGARNWQTA